MGTSGMFFKEEPGLRSLTRIIVTLAWLLSWWNLLSWTHRNWVLMSSNKHVSAVALLVCYGLPCAMLWPKNRDANIIVLVTLFCFLFFQNLLQAGF